MEMKPDVNIFDGVKYPFLFQAQYIHAQYIYFLPWDLADKLIGEKLKKDDEKKSVAMLHSKHNIFLFVVG